jgi:GT2 family glycosyltransferase
LDELFSVIIPSWNGVHLLPACLDSLRAQTYRNFEVMMADSASSDNSVALVRETYPEVRVIVLPQNRGFSGGTNAGIRESRGTWVAVLNQDVVAHPRWLEQLARTASICPEAGAIASKIMLMDQRDRLHSAGDEYRADGIPVNRGVWEKDQGQFDQATEVFGACGGAAAYRRVTLEQVGAFDESFFMYCEDVDLAWRHQLAGWRAVFAPDAIAYHHLSASGGGVTASYYTGRNTIYVIAKNIPGSLLQRHWRSMLRAQLRIAKDALRAWRGEASRARLRGQLAGLIGWPRMLGRRRAIQGSRRVSIDYLENLLQPID